MKISKIFSRAAAAALSAAIAISVYVPAGSVGGGAITFDSKLCGVCEGENANDNNYVVHADTTKSYLYGLDSGDLLRVQAGNGEFAVEYFTEDYSLIGCKHIKNGLPIFGGFYAGSDGNYYVLTGQENSGGSDTKEVFRVTKYDNNWKTVSQDSICDANTKMPFENGGASFAESGDYLIIRTCHSTFSNTGSNDQAVAVIQYNMETEKITDSFCGVEDRAGYVAHSLGQKAGVSAGHAVFADHSDSLPRGISLNILKRSVNSGKITEDGDSDYTRTVIRSVSGKDGNYETGMSLGGFEVTPTSYLVAINSIDTNSITDIAENAADTNNYSRSRDIYIISVPKTESGFGEPVTRNITNYAEEGKSAGTPHLIKITDSSYMALWKNGKNVEYALVAADGTPGDIYTFEGAELSDCKPIFYKGKVVWYTFTGGSTTFYEIKVSDFTKTEKTTMQTGHDCEFVSCSGGVATLLCKRCGETVRQKVPTSIKVYSNTDGSGYFKDYTDIRMELTDVLYLSYGTSPDDIDNRDVEPVSYDEEILSFDSEGNKFLPLKVGKTPVVFAATFNPSAKFSINVTVDGDCIVTKPDNVKVTKDGEIVMSGGTVRLDDEITVTADPPIGKKLKGLYANGTAIKNGSTIAVEGDTEIKDEYEDLFVLKKPDNVIVKRGTEELSDGAYIDTGDKLVITAEPPEGKNLSSLMVNGSNVKSGSNYTVTADTEIEVEFVDKFRITISDNVTVKRGSSLLATGDYIDAGDKLVITATAPEGKRLTGLTANGTSVSNGATYTVTGDTAIIAQFADKFRISFDSSVVTVKRSGKALEDKDFLEEGDKLVITVTPPEGKRLIAIYINDTEYTAGSTYTVTGNTQVIPQFDDKFRITIPECVTVKKGGKVVADGDTIDAGDKLTITCTPPEGKRLVGLYVNGEEFRSGATYTVIAETVVNAELADSYKLTFNEGVTVKRSSKPLENGAFLEAGDKLVITVTPPEGKRLTGLYVNDGEFNSGATFTVVGDTDVIALFEDKFRLTLSENVTVKRNSKVLTDGELLDEKDKLVITADPPEGKRLTGLYVNGEEWKNGATYTVTGDTEVFAEFLDKFRISIPENVTVKRNNKELADGELLDENDKLTITATPPAGKRLDRLYVNDTEFKNGSTWIVKSDTIVNVEFADKYKVYFDSTVTVKKGNTALANESMIDEGDKLVISAIPPEGKRLVSLTVNGEEIKSGSTYTVTKDTNIIAEYDDKFRITIPERVTVKKGTVELEDNAMIDEGDKLTVIAYPPEGKRLVYIRINGAEFKNGSTYTVVNNTVITVEFADKYRVTIPDNVTVKNGKNVLENGSMIDEGDKLTITAVPPEGHRLVSLSVNGEDIKNGSVWTVAGETEINVEFADKYTLTVPENVTVKRGTEVLEDGAKIDVGEKLVISASAPEGKRITAVKVNDTEIKNGATYTVAGDTTIELELADRYVLTLADGVTAKVGTKVLEDGAYIDAGDKITITAAAPEGKNVYKVFANGIEIKNGGLYTADGDTIITVEYTDRYKIIIPSNVIVKRNSKPLTNGDFVDVGDKLVITANPPADRPITALYVNGEEWKSGDTYSVSGNTEITVEYENGFILTIPENVIVIRDDSVLADGASLNTGDVLSISAEPPYGKILKALYVNGIEIDNDSNYVVAGDTVITAEFEKDPAFSGEIKGSVSVRGSSDSPVKVILRDKDGNLVGETTAATGTFGFTDLPVGDYELELTCKDFVPRTYNVTAGSEPVQLDGELRRYGDITGDGNTDARDATQILRFAAGLSSMIRPDPNGAPANEYLIKVGCIVSTELPDSKDATQILRFEAGMTSMLQKLFGLE